MSSSLVLRIELDLAPADRGGRRRPVTDGYRASMSFGRRRRDVEPVVHDAILVLEEADRLAPGRRATARAWVVSPDELPRDLAPGAIFTLLENDRIVARAELLELLEDPVDHPLQDLRAAKTRLLRPRSPLTLRAEDIRRLGYRVVDAIAEHWERLPELPPVVTGDPVELRERLGGPPPDAPGDVDAALEVLLRDVVPNVQHGDHPRFFARVGSPSNPVSALADALAVGTNLIAASWTGGSGPSAVELVVLDWIRAWCGLPEGTEGVLVSGGSVGSLTALAAAREARPGRRAAVVSDQTHSSVVRALRLLALEPRVLPSDDGFRLRVADVERELRRGDVACVVATAGTTNTGAVDPLDAIADLCAAHDAWLHVDGAYGGPAVLTERGAELLRGIERADSLVLDPHKWLFQPYECGCVLVREPGALGRAFSMLPEYLRDVAAPAEVNFRDRGPQLSRGARALKLWLSVHAFGVAAFRAGVARGIANAERAEAAVERTDGLEVVTPAQLGILTLRHTRTDAAELVDRVVADGFAAPSSTVLRGETVLRLCMLNPRTTYGDVDATIARIAALG